MRRPLESAHRHCGKRDRRQCLKHNAPWLADAGEPGGDVDAVAHQVAVAFLDHVTQMNADTKLDATLGGQADVALDYGVLHFDGAAHSVDHAAKLDPRPVAGTLDDAPVVDRDRRVDQIAAQRAQTGECAVFVRAGEPAEADDVGSEDRGEFASVMVPSAAAQASTTNPPMPPPLSGSN
jgi:hypothetical protein